MSFAIVPSSPGPAVLSLNLSLNKRETVGARGGVPPVPATPLFGRQAALADLCALMAQPRTRLLTLTGAGGTGKSRLALELVSEVGSAYTRRWFVDLTTIRQAESVPSAIGQALGVQEGGGKPLSTIFHELLAGQASLLVLDNFEHVMDAAPFVADLLNDCPQLVVVVTSREALGLRHERVYFVGPLPVPDLTRLDDAEAVRQVPSVILFEERARSKRATFQLTDQVLPAVAEICARLDGLPLAIELAAAQAAVLTPPAILARMTTRAPLLGIVQRDLPARHQTLESTVAWSYALLEPAEQHVFRACGVFAGSFNATAVEAVCGDSSDHEDALAALFQLATKSLVRVVEDAADEPRFWLLATIRDYARDQLARGDELPAARARHAAYYVELAEKLQPGLRGSDVAATLDTLARDYANFRAVFQWASEVGDLATGLRLAGALHRFWIGRGPLTEARSWLESALPRSESVTPPIRAAALNTAGVLSAMQHDHPRAIADFEESLRLWQALGDSARQAGTHLNLGLVAYITRKFDEAEHHFEQGHRLYQSIGDRSGQARAIAHRARLAHEQQDLARAARLLSESLELSQAVNDEWGTAHSLANLGHLRLSLDERPAAGDAFRQALQVWRALGNLVDIAECLEGLAAVVADAHPRRAVRLLGAAEALRERSGAPIAAADEARYRVLVARLRRQLREDTFTAAWRDGRGLPMDAAIDLALLADEAPVAPNDHTGILSPREREIARMIARGQSNREIAEALVVSIKTVETHVQHIFGKLQVKARAEVAVWATRHGVL